MKALAFTLDHQRVVIGVDGIDVRQERGPVPRSGSPASLLWRPNCFLLVGDLKFAVARMILSRRCVNSCRFQAGVGYHLSVNGSQDTRYGW